MFINKMIKCDECGLVFQKEERRYLIDGKLYCEQCRFKHKKSSTPFGKWSKV